MAVSSGNGVVPPPPDRMPAAVGGGGNGESAVVHRPPQPQPQPHWFLDERDSFITWLRAEFAAANAIVDLLVHHLRALGESGEYDQLAASISQRRGHWMPVLHMQQFYPIGEVAFALQQVAWKKQQQQQHQALQQHRHFGAPPREKDGWKPGLWHRNGYGHRLDGVQTDHGGSAASAPIESKQGIAEKVKDNVVEEDVKQKGEAEKTGVCNNLETEDNCSWKDGKTLTKSSSSNLELVSLGENHIQDSQDQDGKKKGSRMPRDFRAMEMHNGKLVNVVEGLKLYEDLLDKKEIAGLISYASEMRITGRKGELLGSTFVMGRRPMKGHGREFIQLGVPITRVTAEDMTQSSREMTVEAISHPLHEVFDRFFEIQILPSKPDFCIIDFFNEGDFSHPQIWPHWYGRPICNLFLTECDIVYGREISVDQRGSYSGSLKLSVSAGSLLVIDGNSIVLARRAIPSHKQRIILTFGKSRTRNDHAEGPSFPSSTASPPLSWGSQSARSLNISRESPGSKHYGLITTAAVATTPVHPQSIPANGIQPRFIAPSLVAPAPLPYPPASAPLSPSPTGWTTAAPVRHPVPRVPLPGTGVFLPPGSSHCSASQQMEVTSDSAEANFAVETLAGVERASKGSVSPITSPNGRDASGPKLVPNETFNGTSNGISFCDTSVGNGHHQNAAAKKLSNNLTGISIK